MRLLKSIFKQRYINRHKGHKHKGKGPHHGQRRFDSQDREMLRLTGILDFNNGANRPDKSFLRKRD